MKGGSDRGEEGCQVESRRNVRIEREERGMRRRGRYKREGENDDSRRRRRVDLIYSCDTLQSF